jgi:hypothetical protein
LRTKGSAFLKLCNKAALFLEERKTAVCRTYFQSAKFLPESGPARFFAGSVFNFKRTVRYLLFLGDFSTTPHDDVALFMLLIAVPGPFVPARAGVSL